MAGEALLGRYYAPIERFFVNKVSTDKVYDLMQETFKACVEGRERIARSGRFRPYLFGIAHRLFQLHLRDRYRTPAHQPIDDISIRDLSKSPVTALGKKREQRLLLEALRAIPMKYQLVLELYYWEEMRTADIAELLELPVGTVRSRMSRARDSLHAALSRLARSPEELQSTLSGLEDWAAACAREISTRA